MLPQQQQQLPPPNNIIPVAAAGVTPIRSAPVMQSNTSAPVAPEQQRRLTPQQQRIIVKGLQILRESGMEENSQHILYLIQLLRDRGIIPCLQFTPNNNNVITSSATASTNNVAAASDVSDANNTIGITLSELEQSQLFQLRSQLMAYKMITKNLPVPQELQLAAGGLPTYVPPLTLDVNGVPAPVDEAQNRREQMGARVVQAVQQMQQQLGPKNIVNTLHAKRVLVPSQLPLTVDLKGIRHERESLMQARIEQRIAELQSLPANIPNDIKIKALVELKALRLRLHQRKLRSHVWTVMKKSTLVDTSTAKAAYRKLKKQTIKEARVTEKLERQQQYERDLRDRQSKQKRKDELAAIVQHAKDMKEQNRVQAQRAAKLGRSVLQWHSNTEREEQKRRERLIKERTRLLRENDEEAYITYIDEQKDTRITYLLQQTDHYLKELSAKVLELKNVAGDEDRTAEEDGGASTSNAVVPAMSEEELAKKDFFQIAHSVSEKIEKQPSMLVGGELKDYQLKGLEWMVSLYNNNLNGILADEMGLGKTIQSIALISYLMETKKLNGPYLIIVPLSTLPNWRIEFQKWAPSINVIVYIGTIGARKVLQQQVKALKFNVLLTTYDFVMRDKSQLSKIKWVSMIVDEGHRMKNAHCKLTIMLTQFYSSRHRMLLTGTPLQNNLPELWALLNFLLPTIFKSVKSFEEWFNAPFANTGEHLELTEEETLLVIRRLHKVLRPFMLRRLKTDVESQLPDKVEKVLKCNLSAAQQVLYEQIEKGTLFFKDGGSKIQKRGISNTIMQLRKVCNHPFVFREVEDMLNPGLNVDDMIVRTSGKFELLDRILPKFQQSGHKVLMFFQMTNIMNIFQDYCTWKGYSFLRLDGSTKAEDRRVAMNTWNNPEEDYFLFLLSTRAGGLGLNLQTADTVIIFDSDWNPHQDLQAQDRAHRIGQKSEVRVYRLVCSKTVEEGILSRAQYKLDVDSKVIQAGKFDQKTSIAESEDYLRALLQVDKEVQEEEDVFDDEELNEILARNPEELELFNKIDEEIARARLESWRAQGHKGRPSRLIDMHELPDGFRDAKKLNEEQEQKEKELTKRQRAEVHYDDGLTEAQWTKIVDQGGSVDEVVLKRRKAREKRLRKRLQRQKEEESDSDDSSVSSAPSTPVMDSPPASSKKRKSKALEISEPIASPTTKRLKITLSRSGSSSKLNTPTKPFMTPEQRNSIMFTLLDALSESKASDGRYRAELFEVLPSHDEYPDYYEVITKPIAIDMIRENIENNQYSDVNDFAKDVNQMCKNAMTYNVEGSEVYNNAIYLRNFFNRKFKEQFPPE